jgi:redox-sensing transcriptional repressor
MAFDNDINKCDNKKIFHIDKMDNLIKKMNINLGIITVPKDSAQEVCDSLVKCGIKAIWNFAPINLKVTNDVVVKNEDLSSGLLVLINKYKNNIY